MITIACVWTGDKYPVEYVTKLRAMVRRHMPRDVSYQFVCVTDRPNDLPPSISSVDVSRYELPGWWAKMTLFDPRMRNGDYWYYFDLDTVICGNLGPLIRCRPHPMGICENFARLAGATKWPCHYGSCVMGFESGWGLNVWATFQSFVNRFTTGPNARYGDQYVIEELVPNAVLWQRVLPPDFFLNYRDVTAHKPKGAAVVVFGGRARPRNSPHAWIREEWQ